jgi:DNA polymerase-3 subunit gamma/tau
MVIIRLAHAGNLPAPEDAARRIAGLLSGDIPAPSPSPRGNGSGASSEHRPMAEARAGEMARSPSGGPTAMLSAVPRSQPEAPPAPKIEDRPEPKVHLKSLADIAAMAGEARDMKLKAQVRQFVRPVRMEPGKLEIALSPDAPKTIANDLFVKLKEWTGIHWNVSVVAGPGGLTIVETEARQRDERLTDARSDPDVAAILSRFPGARITDVRVTQIAPDEEAEAIPEADFPDDNE